MVITYTPNNAMNTKYVVELSENERSQLMELVSKGKSSARQLKRANILLMADVMKPHQDKDISDALNVGTSTIYRTKKRFVEDGLSEALSEGARPGMPRKLDANQDALLIALACSQPPQGLCRWTLTLLADKLVSLSDVETISKASRVDYEYKRVSVANIFMFFDRHKGWRKAKVTPAKKAEDFAQCMKELVDEHYPDADKIHVVMDNYSTHKAGSLYKAFKPEEALRILNRLEFHYTPKHASWLNMVEIEIGNMNQQCLDRRIPTWDKLQSELVAWEKLRNEARATIKWMFNVDAARKKLTRAYEKLNQS